jgi:hypothetical protein
LADKSYEESLQEFLVSMLYARVGEPGSLHGEGKNARFEIKRSLGGGTCAAGAAFDYALPSGRKVTHIADILVTLPHGRRLTIDLKWASEEFDFFKARAYDMLLIKQSLGRQLWAMMVYLRPLASGVSAERVQEICFPFDLFFACEHQDPQNPAIWVPIVDRIEAEITAI